MHEGYVNLVAMNEPLLKSHGRLIAKVLSGAWRQSPPDLECSTEELAELAPLLLGSGAGALAWWRVRNTDLRASTAATELQKSYLLHTIHASLFAHKTKQAVSLLRSNEIEPILIKGWACARLYPELGLRPYGDVDLCVNPNQYAKAKSLFDGPEGRDYWVDLHQGLRQLDDKDWDELFGRSQLASVEEMSVRILSDEDHLRVLCMHWLGDGAWRPILLCDIAAAIESASANFDWDSCLGKDKRRAKWITSTIGLAHHLLGANLERCPLSVRDAQLPSWLVPTVLRQWETPRIKEHRPPEFIMTSLRHPSHLPKALRNRWPDPIGATIRVKGPFNALPRLPFQITDYFFQTARFLTRLPRLLQSQRHNSV